MSDHDQLALLNNATLEQKNNAKNIINQQYDEAFNNLHSSKSSLMKIVTRNNNKKETLQDLEFSYSPYSSAIPFEIDRDFSDNNAKYFKRYAKKGNIKYKDSIGYLTTKGKYYLSRESLYNRSVFLCMLLTLILLVTDIILTFLPLSDSFFAIYLLFMLVIPIFSLQISHDIYIKRYNNIIKESQKFKKVKIQDDKNYHLVEHYINKISNDVSWSTIQQQLSNNNELLALAKITNDTVKNITRSTAWNNKETAEIRAFINPKNEFNQIMIHLANIGSFRQTVNNPKITDKQPLTETLDNMMTSLQNRIIELELLHESMITLSEEIIELEQLEYNLNLLDTMDKYHAQIVEDEFAQLDLISARARIEGIRETIRIRIKNLTA